jgi:hypothetical protein
MKYLKSIPAVFLIVAAFFISVGVRADDANPAGSTSANSVAASKPVPYPLDTCIVSGDKFGGDMGPPVVFIYQDKAKGINQEIKFCCPMCKPKFLADPDKYIKIILAAEAKAKDKAQK